MMENIAEAEKIVLVSRKPKAPPFHQFIVKKKLVGQSWQVGDQAVIYDIVDTIPAGRVRVTDRTVIEFAAPAG